MLSKEMLDFICDHEKEAYDLLLSLARIPAPLNHEEKRAQFCARWLKEQGAEGVYIDEALNVVYPVDAEGDGPLEVYMAHTDVVFSDTQELPLKVEDGRIYCPGIVHCRKYSERNLEKEAGRRQTGASSGVQFRRGGPWKLKGGKGDLPQI